MGSDKKKKAEKAIEELKEIVLAKKEVDYWGQILNLAKTLKNYYIKLREQEKEVETKKAELTNVKVNKILDDSVSTETLETELDALVKELNNTEKVITDMQNQIKSMPEIQQLFNFL